MRAPQKVARFHLAALLIRRQHDLLVLVDNRIRIASSNTFLSQDAAGRILLFRYQLLDADIHLDSAGRFAPGCGPRVDAIIDDLNNNVIPAKPLAAATEL